MAPVCLVVVAILLYLFRSIYGEVVTALPVNGGAYNVLLNTTSKTIASLAACLTLLSYVATGVVSGTDAALYAQTLWRTSRVAAPAHVLTRALTHSPDVPADVPAPPPLVSGCAHACYTPQLS